MPLQKTQKKAQLPNLCKITVNNFVQKTSSNSHGCLYQFWKIYICTTIPPSICIYVQKNYRVFFFIQKRSEEKDIDFVYFIDEVWIKKYNNY